MTANVSNSFEHKLSRYYIYDMSWVSLNFILTHIFSWRAQNQNILRCKSREIVNWTLELELLKHFVLFAANSTRLNFYDFPSSWFTNSHADNNSLVSKLLPSFSVAYRPGKLDILFRISHLLVFHACGRTVSIYYCKWYIVLLHTLGKFMALRPFKVGVSLLRRR